MEVFWKLSQDMAFIGYWLLVIIGFLEVSIFPTEVSTQGNNFDCLSFWDEPLMIWGGPRSEN